MMGFWLLGVGCNEQPESSGLVVIDAMMPTDAFDDFDSNLDALGQDSTAADADAAQLADARPQTPADVGGGGAKQQGLHGNQACPISRCHRCLGTQRGRGRIFECHRYRR